MQVEVNADGEIEVFIREVYCFRSRLYYFHSDCLQIIGTPTQPMVPPAVIKDEGASAENLIVKRTCNVSHDDNDMFVPAEDDEPREVRPPKKGRSAAFSFATAGRAQKLEEKKNDIKPYLLAAVQARDGYIHFHEMKGRPNQHPTVIKNIYLFARDFVKDYDDRMTSTVKVFASLLAETCNV